MGFGGSAAAMIQSIRNNAKQLSKRKGYFEKNVSSTNESASKFIDYKKMSPHKFEAFKQKLKEEELRRQRKLALIFGSVMLVIIGAVVYFLFFY